MTGHHFDIEYKGANLGIIDLRMRMFHDANAPLAVGSAANASRRGPSSSL